MIMLVSAFMCVRRKRPLADAGGVQLSNLVASMGQHLIPAHRRRGLRNHREQLFPHRRTNGRHGGGVFGRRAKSLYISSQQCRFETKYKRLRF